MEDGESKAFEDILPTLSSFVLLLDLLHQPVQQLELHAQKRITHVGWWVAGSISTDCFNLDPSDPDAFALYDWL